MSRMIRLAPTAVAAAMLVYAASLASAQAQVRRS